MKYKVWIELEEIDEEGDAYQNLDDEGFEAGEFETLDEARAYRDWLAAHEDRKKLYDKHKAREGDKSHPGASSERREGQSHVD